MYFIYNYKTRHIVAWFNTLTDARKFAKANGWKDENIRKLNIK